MNNVPFSKTLLRLGTGRSTNDNWKKVRRAVSKYLLEKKKIQKVRKSLKAERYVTELDEEILAQLRNNPHGEEFPLTSECNFRSELIEEKKGEKETTIRNFDELKSPSIIPLKQNLND
jgi:hypothetical protein